MSIFTDPQKTKQDKEAFINFLLEELEEFSDSSVDEDILYESLIREILVISINGGIGLHQMIAKYQGHVGNEDMPKKQQLELILDRIDDQRLPNLALFKGYQRQQKGQREQTNGNGC